MPSGGVAARPTSARHCTAAPFVTARAWIATTTLRMSSATKKGGVAAVPAGPTRSGLDRRPTPAAGRCGGIGMATTPRQRPPIPAWTMPACRKVCSTGSPRPNGSSSSSSRRHKVSDVVPTVAKATTTVPSPWSRVWVGTGIPQLLPQPWDWPATPSTRPSRPSHPPRHPRPTPPPAAARPPPAALPPECPIVGAFTSPTCWIGPRFCREVRAYPATRPGVDASSSVGCVRGGSSPSSDCC